MSNSPTLHTQRLRLRCPVKEDIDLFYRLHSDPEVMRYIGNGDPHDQERVIAYVAKVMNKLSSGSPLYNWWMAEQLTDGAFIGWFVLKDLDNTDELELGYRLMTNYWGQGYANEGSKAVLDYGFKELELERIVAVTLPENIGSRRVIEKVGMEYRRTDKFYGSECLYYDISKKAYKKSQ